MKTIVRYALFQIPGIVFAGFILFLLFDFSLISWQALLAILLLWILKDVVFYPLVRNSYRPHPTATSNLPVGRIGITREPLEPRGQILIGGELWLACSLNDVPIPADVPVRVLECQGLVATVEPCEE